MQTDKKLTSLDAVAHPTEPSQRSQTGQQRTSTKIAKSFRSNYGVKVLRAMRDVYDSSLIRLSIATDDLSKLPDRVNGEMRRTPAHGLFGLMPQRTWIYINPQS